MHLDVIPLRTIPTNHPANEPDAKSTVGETVYWHVQFTDDLFEVGGDYLLKITDENGDTVWERYITARSENI